MRRFLIPSLLAAGFAANTSEATPIISSTMLDSDDTKSIFQKLRMNHVFTLAGHSSHVSHASHASHRSSTGGYSAPLYTPPVVRTVPAVRLYDPPATKVLPGNAAKFTSIVMQVQVGLMSYGYYDGAIDGVIGPKAKEALKRFQTDYALKVTGTVTPEVLDRLGIVAQ